MIYLYALLMIQIQAWAIAPNGNELLHTSDRARGAAASLQGLTWTADVNSVEDGDARKVTYSLKVKGNDAIAEVMLPARQKGEIILFNDRNLWFYKPGIKKPVSISARQKLLGQAAYGDIASTNYARDYESVSVIAEMLNGMETWKLDLKAKSKNVTYDHIRYWVAKKDQIAVKAEFLTVSGEIFKTATFKHGNTVKIGGATFPFIDEMRIQDAHNQQNITTITYKEAKEQAHSSALFNVNNLIK